MDAVKKLKPKPALTANQDAFAQGIARGLTQSDAYREAYPVSVNWKPDSLHNKASAMARDARVVARIEALRAPVVKKLQYTLQTAMDEAMRAYDLAAATNQTGSMVAAAALRAKLQGLLVEKREVKVTSFDNFDAEAKQTMIEAANAELTRRKQLAIAADIINDDVIDMVRNEGDPDGE